MMRPCSRSTKKIRPGWSRPLRTHVLGRRVEHADLGRRHQEAVLRHHVARGPQSVAVEHRADLGAVGERDRRGPVPGLEQAGVVLVVGAPVLVHQRMVLPGLGDHHADRVRQAAAGQDQELERVVERAGVAASRPDDRVDLLQVVAEQLGAQRPLARVHPVHVAAQRVDLAVVAEVAVGMRQIPGREGVGRVARVHERERDSAGSDRRARCRSRRSAGRAAGPCRRPSGCSGSGCGSRRCASWRRGSRSRAGSRRACARRPRPRAPAPPR